MKRQALLLSTASLLAACAPTLQPAQATPEAGGLPGTVPVVQATAQNTSVTDPADSDDPAIWVDERDPSRSFVIATRKEGGLTSFDLSGQTLQNYNPGEIRYNNVDLVRGFRLSGKVTDLAVVSERKGDTVAVFAIDPKTRQLREVTSPDMPALFTPAGQKSDGDSAAYGLAAYRAAGGAARVLVTRNGFPSIAELELVDDGQGRVSARKVRQYNFPAGWNGLEVEDAQFEGMVVDAENGYAFLGQEEVGVWRLRLGTDRATLVAPVAPLGQHLTADVEGLALVRGAGKAGYLLVSSQGSDRYVVYDRTGERYLGSFQVALGSDTVTHSDGADVTPANLGGAFSRGLLVVQDGDAGGVEDVTNFKLVPWGAVADALGLPPL